MAICWRKLPVEPDGRQRFFHLIVIVSKMVVEREISGAVID